MLQQPLPQVRRCPEGYNDFHAWSFGPPPQGAYVEAFSLVLNFIKTPINLTTLLVNGDKLFFLFTGGGFMMCTFMQWGFLGGFSRFKFHMNFSMERKVPTLGWQWLGHWNRIIESPVNSLVTSYALLLVDNMAAISVASAIYGFANGTYNMALQPFYQTCGGVRYLAGIAVMRSKGLGWMLTVAKMWAILTATAEVSAFIIFCRVYHPAVMMLIQIPCLICVFRRQYADSERLPLVAHVLMLPSNMCSPTLCSWFGANESRAEVFLKAAWMRYIVMLGLCCLDFPTAPIRHMGRSVFISQFWMMFDEGWSCQIDPGVCIFRSFVIVLAAIAIPLYLICSVYIICSSNSLCQQYRSGGVKIDVDREIDEKLYEIEEYAWYNSGGYEDTPSLFCSLDPT